MEIPTGLIIVIVIYGILYFFDTVFRTCAHYPYVQFLRGSGLELKFLQMRWHTTALNRIMVRWGVNCLRFFNFWFKFGVYACLTLLPIATLILIASLIQDFLPTVGKEAPIMEPIIPFVNLPSSEIGFFSISLLFSSIVHELGHALAAVTEDVHIDYFGTNVFFILPVAYVSLNSEKLFSLSRSKVLKILCAGIWHNLVLTCVCYLIYLTLPMIFSLVFTTGSGVYINEMLKNSPVSGVKGFLVGDVVTKINDCEVTTQDSWYGCLHNSQQSTPSFCFDSDLVHELEESVPVKHDQGIVDCCGKTNPKNLCFAYLDGDKGVLELPPYACLPARDIITSSSDFCNEAPHTCPDNSYCFRPILSNSSKLFKVERVGAPHVMYIGLASDMSRFIYVSSYVPKYIFTTSTFPDVVTKLLGYITVFSLGLGIINILPCAYMDGQYIMNIIVPWILGNHADEGKVKVISSVICIFTTFFLLLHVMYVLFTFLI